MRLMKLCVALVAWLSLFVQDSLGRGKASRVVLMVWDGMRPDFISPENTPNLCRLTGNGVWFTRHHPVYISSTEVNATALATGVYPGQSAIIANNEYRPAINPLEAVAVQDTDVVRKGDQVEDGKYLQFPTVAEILQANGFRTAITGSKQVALLHDRLPGDGVTVFAGQSLPPALATSLPTFPRAGVTKIRQDQWTTDTLIDAIWKDNLPSYSLLWLAEPDYSQHKFSPGAPQPLKAIKNNDACLGRVIDALKQKNQFDDTDIVVVSDHGFSTIGEHVDVEKTLNVRGFHAMRRFPASGPAKGDILCVSDGGIVLFYNPDHDPALIQRAIHCLQEQSFTGIVLSRDGSPGTFSFADLHLDSPASPDFAVIMRWDLRANQFGAPGTICCDKAMESKGSHATLCPTEMHNLGAAFGPDFVRGERDPLPSGNIDIAPTILWILGVTPPQPMSGRVLSEALTFAGPAIESVVPHHRETSWHGNDFVWRQYLNSTTVNGVTYFDEGNGLQSPASRETSSNP